MLAILGVMRAPCAHARTFAYMHVHIYEGHTYERGSAHEAHFSTRTHTHSHTETHTHTESTHAHTQTHSGVKTRRSIKVEVELVE